jgi:GT2 family glycosyltransferase/glycosyltransferase involved in cell wall biosynthesis
MQSMRAIAKNINDGTSKPALVIISNNKIAAREITQLNSMFAMVSVVKPLRTSEIDKITKLPANIHFVETLLSYAEYDKLYVDPNIVLLNPIIIPANTSLFFKQYNGQISTKLVYLKAGNQFNTAFSVFHKGQWITNITEIEFTYVIHNNFLIAKALNDKNILNGKAYNDANIPDNILASQIAVDTTNAMFQNSKTTKLVENVISFSKVSVLSRILNKQIGDGLVPFANLISEKKINVINNQVSLIKKNIVFELPFYDSKSGGINRRLKIVAELPYYSTTSGGIHDSILMAQSFDPTMEIRFQNLSRGYPPQTIGAWSVGLPDETFPECDICITYSDNPHLGKLVNLPQVRKVFILMLSYGMHLLVERANVLNPKVTVLCSSKKLEKAIRTEKVKVHRLGIGLDMSEMYVDPNIRRKKYVALLYHSMPSKQYDTAVEVTNSLYNTGAIDGVITFGLPDNYAAHRKPLGLVKHYDTATPTQIREIFNTCQCFLMPSLTEGLNLTPIEATLCGCPAVICDGAINEVFFDKTNCLVVPVNDTKKMTEECLHVIDNYKQISESFRKDMLVRVSAMTWPKVLETLTQVIIESEPSNVVIIPVHNQLDYVKACVKTVIEKTSKLKLIIVDDGSTDPEIEKWVKSELDCTYIRHGKAQGFSAACNAGIQYAINNFSFDTLCLLNSDTEIMTDNWFNKVQSVMQSNNIAIAGPISNSAVYQTIIDLPTYLQTIDTKPMLPTIFVHGFCYFIRRDVVLKIGILDVTVFPHYGSEDDYSLRAIKFGYKNAMIGSVFVKHHGETSYSKDGRAELLKTSLPNLSDRWGATYVSQCVADTHQSYKKLNNI